MYEILDIETDRTGAQLTPGERFRRTMMILFGCVVVLGFVVSGAYVAVRAMAGEKAQSKMEAPPAFKSLPPTKPAPSVSPSAATIPPAAPQPALPVTQKDPIDAGLQEAMPKLPPLPPWPAHPGHPINTPLPGAYYLQVGALDRTVAEIFVEVLSQKGFSSIIAPGPDAKTFRVLVGPLEAGSELRLTKVNLAEEGFFSFIRWVPHAEAPSAGGRLAGNIDGKVFALPGSSTTADWNIPNFQR